MIKLFLFLRHKWWMVLSQPKCLISVADDGLGKYTNYSTLPTCAIVLSVPRTSLALPKLRMTLRAHTVLRMLFMLFLFMMGVLKKS